MTDRERVLNREWMRKARAEARAGGWCPKCRKGVLDGWKTCRKCRGDESRTSKARRARKDVAP